MIARTKATSADKGNAKAFHKTIFPAFFHFTLLKLLAAPVPIIAVFLIVPVDNGKPNKVATNKPIDEAISVAKAWWRLMLAIPRPKLFNILRLPTKQPTDKTIQAGNNIHHVPLSPSTATNNVVSAFTFLYKIAAIKTETPMNLPPSWMPWTKLIKEQENICP